MIVVPTFSLVILFMLLLAGGVMQWNKLNKGVKHYTTVWCSLRGLSVLPLSYSHTHLYMVQSILSIIESNNRHYQNNLGNACVEKYNE